MASTQVSAPFAVFHSRENPSGNGPRLDLTFANEPVELSPFAGDWDPVQISYFGGNSDSDRVVASFIMADGRIALVANYGTGTPGGVVPQVLAAANNSSAGMVVIMDENASEVLSVTRVAPTVVDAVLGPNDEILIAAAASGAILLDSSASQLLWHFDGAGSAVNIQRVAMAQDGHIATLSATPNNQSASRDLNAGGRIRIFYPNGTLRADWPAHLQAQNLTIDSNLGRVYTTGYNQTFGGPNPVQIAYVRSQNLDGDVIHWTAYDWRGNDLEPIATPGVINNMADTRGYQVLVGPDGMLYAGFESAGGNHIMRWDPFDLNVPVTVVGGDPYHQFFNSFSDHKMIIVRMDPITAEVDRVQQFTARVGTAGRTNGARLIRGQMAVDSAGRIHVVTDTASGGDSAATTFMVGLPLTYNPVPVTEYGGGGAYLILSPDMTTRLHLSRVGSRVRPWTLHVRDIPGEPRPRVIYGGATENFADVELATLNAFQPQRGSTIDGYFVLSRPIGTTSTEPAIPGFASWIADAGLGVPAGLRGPMDTPAGDGLPNLLKFFAGLEPMVPGSHSDILSILREGGQHWVAFTQHNRAAAVDFVLEVSTDLDNWLPVPMDSLQYAPASGDTGQWYLPLDPMHNERQFFRLGVFYDQ